MESGGNGSGTCFFLAEAPTGFLLLIMAECLKNNNKKKRKKNFKVTVYSNTAWSPLTLDWENETSLRQRTPTKKCEKLKWQGCVDSLLNEWREWIEIYIYIAPFIYSVSLRTEEFTADLLCQHRCIGEWSRIGLNVIFHETGRTKIEMKKGKEPV